MNNRPGCAVFVERGRIGGAGGLARRAARVAQAVGGGSRSYKARSARRRKVSSRASSRSVDSQTMKIVLLSRRTNMPGTSMSRWLRRAPHLYTTAVPARFNRTVLAAVLYSGEA